MFKHKDQMNGQIINIVFKRTKIHHLDPVQIIYKMNSLVNNAVNIGLNTSSK